MRKIDFFVRDVLPTALFCFGDFAAMETPSGIQQAKGSLGAGVLSDQGTNDKETASNRARHGNMFIFKYTLTLSDGTKF